MEEPKRSLKVVLVAGVLVTGVSLLPSARARAVALPTMLEALGFSVSRPLAPTVRPEDTSLGSVKGRLFSPSPSAPAVLLVPGATPEGVEDQRVNQVALAIARAGRQVFIPELELYRESFDVVDIQRIKDAVIALADRSSRPVVVLGISYGGSFSLVAASDPSLEGRLDRVAVFGAYFDLVGVIQAVTTGVSLVGGESIPWDGHPLAKDFLAAKAVELVAEEERARVIDALDGTLDPADLSAEARALHQLISNRDPARTYQLASELPDGARAILDRFSPSAVVDAIDVPVVALHSTDDPLVPYGELLRLAEGLPEARTVTVSLFRHVDFDTSSTREWLGIVPDMWRVWGFASWVLRP